MNTGTSREPRHAICVVEVLLFYSFNLAFEVGYEHPHQNWKSADENQWIFDLYKYYSISSILTPKNLTLIS